ncbi:MAG: mechanosensitive ion channel family protein [Deltaproteobacteria bacterium]|nr:mechanosensitive ion channel family protein [Deltaproteobacteria bacterium]MBW1931024.1 mechanosensitive ion channel family protein [Deltaproteobacteria bacterium]MBW2026124.1 mechanosensitive ion channel family protein [Deltaproteobacteria bacterium]MBW2126862.1 mechanosensitive ion channel family protein [Deltaproteobacteria bacterium]RLB11734.1 MAG: mechanosensitive ion channel family protein [Deltaproteobacteria bacterium]
MMDQLLQFEILGNSLWRIAALFGIVLASLVVGKIVKVVLNKMGARFEAKGRFMMATTMKAVARGAVFLLAAAGLSLALPLLQLKTWVAEVSDTVSAILLSVGVGYFLYWLVDIPTTWFSRIAGRTETKLDDMLVPIIRKSLRVTVVVLVLVQVAQILSDKPITSIIAGLGIGGLALALAAQDTVKNFFGSVVLFVDKPFEMGDRIVVDGQDGSVEEVGLRSTKIRTLDGHLVTVPNGELANKLIRNIGKRPYIRRVANLTITYDTPPDKVERAVEIVKEILDNHEGMHPDLPPRVYFNEFNAESLNILVIYWYHPPDYWAYMAFTEKFNKEVFRRFNEEGIEFAFPTQTLYLAGDGARPLTIGVELTSPEVSNRQ